MNKVPNTRGGARAGAGRPPLSENHKTVPVVIRLTTPQRDHLVEVLGGAEWVRAQIDLAMARDSVTP